MMSQHDILQKKGQYQKRVEDIKWCRAVREFLQTFKTNKCRLQTQHNYQYCHNYHGEKDKRRNPYTNHTFLYYPKKKCACQNTKCLNYHNNFELNYHPIIYKTQKCNKKECVEQTFYCYLLHRQDFFHFEQGQFFRFDINTFKTKKCTRQDKHERKVCLGYHNEKDRRRNNFNDYNHILCNKQNCNNQLCPRSQNKIQQLYHPSRYKSKFCQTLSKDPFLCDYRDFCSFAHTNQQITIVLYDVDNKDPNYIVSNYKTIWCPQTLDHDRNQCPYAHNIQDFRRKPSQYNYKPQRCTNWDFQKKIESIQMSKCPQGMNCGMSHGWFEQKYHPLVYIKNKTTKNYIKKQDSIKNQNLNKIPSDKQKSINNQFPVQIYTKPTIFAVGAPFFKNQSDKTKHPGSQKSCNNSEVNNINSIIKQQKKKNLINGSVAQKVAPVIFQSKQHQIWNFEQQQLNRQKKSDTRSKSQGTSSEYAPSYSRSIVQTLNDSIILNKLYKQNVNQVSLININDNKINNMSFLDNLQKQKLIRKLKQYSLKKYKKGIEYSKILTQFFQKNGAESILTKFLSRRIAQDKILKLHSRQSTKDFSFLQQEQKELLPKLVKRFSQQKQYKCIMYEVQKLYKREE